MAILYNIAFLIFAIFYIPVFLLNRRREGIALRLGLYPEELIERLKERRNIWIHAVSVGEVMALASLMEAIRKRYPQSRIVITTVTETGNTVAHKVIKGDEIVLYLPFDISFVVRKVLGYINPSALIIAETEIWPNLIMESDRRGIPIIIVNGRISDRSFGRYKLVKAMLRPVLKMVNIFIMQSDADSKRIICLGAQASSVKVSGNMKFDSAVSIDTVDKKDKDLMQMLGISDDDKLFIAGSTHPGEEEIVLSVYSELKRKFDNIRLLLAPRHIERANELEGLIKKYGFTPVKVSQLSTMNHELSTSNVFLLDTMGQLKDLYAIVFAVFIGGSMVKKGGQNMIEPAVFKKPILFGPHTSNFRGIADLFIKKEAALLVKDKASLKSALEKLLNEPDRADRLGKSARFIVDENIGATESVIKEIEDAKILL